MAFMIAKIDMMYTKGLTVSLQKRVRHICNAYNEVTTVMDVLKGVRDDIDHKHREWFAMTSALSLKINGSVPQLPRRCSRQTARNNVPDENPEIYFKQTITIPFFDTMISHLQSRFSDIQQQAVCVMTIVPSVLQDDTLPKAHLERN